MLSHYPICHYFTFFNESVFFSFFKQTGFFFNFMKMNVLVVLRTHNLFRIEISAQLEIENKRFSVAMRIFNATEFCKAQHETTMTLRNIFYRQV